MPCRACITVRFCRVSRAIFNRRRLAPCPSPRHRYIICTAQVVELQSDHSNEEIQLCLTVPEMKTTTSSGDAYLWRCSASKGWNRWTYDASTGQVTICSFRNTLRCVTDLILVHHALASNHGFQPHVPIFLIFVLAPGPNTCWHVPDCTRSPRGAGKS